MMKYDYQKNRKRHPWVWETGKSKWYYLTMLGIFLWGIILLIEFSWIGTVVFTFLSFIWFMFMREKYIKKKVRS